MKRIERQHLKENKLAIAVVSFQGFLLEKQRQIVTGLAITLVLLAGFAYNFVLGQQAQSAAQQMFGEAMVVLGSPVQPPIPEIEASEEAPGTPAFQAPGTYPTENAKREDALERLQEVVDAYPDTDAGIQAAYHLAGTLAALNNFEEALLAYEVVIERTGESLYGRMARLGKGNTHVLLEQYEPAIEVYSQLLDLSESGVPVDAVLLKLARTYQAAGNANEAQEAFSRIVHEYPASPYSSEARKEMLN